MGLGGTRGALGGSRCNLRGMGRHVLRRLTMLGLGNSVGSPVVYLCNPPKINGASLKGSVTTTLGQGCVHVSLKNIRSRTRVHKRHGACVNTVPKHVVGGLVGTNSSGPMFVLSRVSGIDTSHRKSPSSTLLRILSPRRGATFRSGFLSISCSLSGIVFVTATGGLGAVPKPLLSQVRLVRIDNCVARRGIRVTQGRLIPGRLRTGKVGGASVGVPGSALRTVVRSCAHRDNIHRLRGGVNGVLHGSTHRCTASNFFLGARVGPASLCSFLNTPRCAHSGCRNGSCTNIIAKLT